MRKYGLQAVQDSFLLPVNGSYWLMVIFAPAVFVLQQAELLIQHRAVQILHPAFAL